ncbi:MAG: glutathione S-transferase [bacterium]|nr:glutathione S-transferase [bacterium]
MIRFPPIRSCRSRSPPPPSPPRGRPVKFYDCQTAPSPRRARIIIAEKGLEIETVEIDLGKAEQLSEAFKRINPRCTVPVLELDDGLLLTENAAIAAYLEALVPDPPLLGTTPAEKGLIAGWNARMEFEGLWPVADALRNRSKGMVDRAITGPTNYDQIPELAERGRSRGIEFFDMLNTRLGEAEYVAGDSFSVADISAFVVTDFASWVKLGMTDAHTNTKRWYDLLIQRPSIAG